MARLLTIPTTRPTVSMEERRAPGTDPDIIPMDDVPVEAPVVDAGTGTGGDAAQTDNIDALAASTSPEAPAAAGADPGVDAAADSSVTDAPAAPMAGDETTPPAAGDDVPPGEAAPDVGTADVPPADAAAPIDDVPAVEPAAAAEGDISPVPDDIAPVAPVETVNEPAAEPAVTDAPAVDPAPEVAAAPAGEEQAAAVVDAASDAAVATDSPVDAGVDPVAPVEAAADTAADVVPVDDGTTVPTDDTSLPPDVADDAPPVTGEAPVPPADDAFSPDPVDSGAPVDLGTEAPVTDGDIPPVDGADPVDGTDVPPADAAAPVEPVEPVDPVADIEPEEMTSAWVDGVAVDAEEVKEQIENAAADVVDADDVTSELEDAAVALEELSSKVSESLAEDNPIVSETTVNLTNIVAEKSLERIGEVLDLPPSMESAVTAHDRLRITLEAIDGKVAQIWEAIKKALAMAWDAIVKFFKTLFDSAYRVKQAIVKLREGIKAINGSEKQSSDKVEGPSVNDVGFKDWKDVSALTQRLTKLAGGLGSFLQNSKPVIHDVILTAGNKIIEVTKSDAESKVREEQMGAVLSQMVTGYSSLGVALTKSVADGAQTDSDTMFNISGVVASTSGELPGGYRLVATDFARGDGMLTLQHIASLREGRFIRVTHNRYTATEAPAANESEMLALLDVTEQLVDAVLESKDGVSKFESDIASFRRQAETALRDCDSEYVKKADVSGYIRAVAAIGPSLVKQNSTLISMAVSVANGAVKYITASAKLYPSFGNSTVSGETTAPAGTPALAAPAT